jgi:hypothetical protein
MRTGVYALLAISAFGGFVFAQTPTQPQTGAAQGQAPDSAATPLTPVEQRDLQIRQVDPLDQEDKESKEKTKAGGDAEKRQGQDQTPVPGSIAATEQNAQGAGPQVVEGGDAEAPVQEYTGPAVLSRSYSISQPLIPQELKWEETLGVSGIYDTGISREINANGSPGAPQTLIGTMASWRLMGRHYFRRDQIGVVYSGNISQYAGNTGYSGSNNALAMNYTHVLSRRFKLNLAGSGSIFSLNSVLENQPVGPETIASINLSTSPNIEIYDNGGKQFSSQADLVWQKTSRLSFSIGTSYFGIERDSTLLLGVTGQQARGDVTYRVTRKTTIGSYYSFSHYLYPHGFGNSVINTAGLIYSYSFNPTTQLRFRGGVSLVESLGLETVAINPVIATLLGVNSGVIDAYNTYRATDFSAQFVKDFHGGRTTASLAYARGISPGNGVLQTSQQESIIGSVTARVFRIYSFTAALGRDTLEGVGLVDALGKYQSEYARITLNRTYKRGVGLSFSAEYRYFGIDAVDFVRNQLRITSGVTWGSGTGRLWPF